MVGEALDVTNLAPGKVLLDKYRVVRTLGVGGMGVVVACDHLRLGSRVAIKFLLPNLVNNDMVVKRFMQEARAATRIKSEHVARVIDVGRIDGDDVPEGGIPYMVMEHLEGKDLSDWIEIGKKFPVDEAIEYTLQACEALAQAHKEGIVHRDIKPANLFLAVSDERKVVKVLDFGISKLMDEQPSELSMTKTTTVLGSGLYMSPEQMRSAKNVDFRTDIYSLGVCLFELLTGTQPHTAESFSELCVKVNIDPPTPLRDYRPDISAQLAAVIAKAYAKSADDRYQTVQDLAAALAPFAQASAQPTIDHIQSITHHRSLAPPQPRRATPMSISSASVASIAADQTGPTSLADIPEDEAPTSLIPPPSHKAEIARTSPGVSSSSFPDQPRRRSGAGMVITAALAAIGIFAGIVVLLMDGRQQTTTTPSSSSPTQAATTTPTTTAAPATTTSTPTTSVTASATASASASASAKPRVRRPRPAVVVRPKPKPSAAPKVKPPCVEKKDENGVMMPCL